MLLHDQLVWMRETAKFAQYTKTIQSDYILFILLPTTIWDLTYLG